MSRSTPPAAKSAPSDSVPGSARPSEPTLLFDGDCAFCSRCARWLIDVVRPRASVLPWQQVTLSELGVTSEQCERAVQWISADRTVRAGAPAIAASLRAGRRPWPLLGSVLGLPVIAQIAQLVYALVAAQRHRLPGGTPACRPTDQPAVHP